MGEYTLRYRKMYGFIVPPKAAITSENHVDFVSTGQRKRKEHLIQGNEKKKLVLFDNDEQELVSHVYVFIFIYVYFWSSGEYVYHSVAGLT